MSEQIKAMKETLMAAAQSQMGNLEQVNAKELGEVIDMIKDLEEAEYYCAVVKIMEESKKEQEEREKVNAAVASATNNANYYTPYLRYIEPYVDYNRNYYDGDGNMRGMRDSNNPMRRYYDGNGGSSYSGGSSASMGGNGGRSGYHDPYYPMEIRDYREGKSPLSRRGYMESKEQHKGAEIEMRELEKYMNELGSDITEMIAKASPEEKSLLLNKMSTLMSKIK